MSFTKKIVITAFYFAVLMFSTPVLHAQLSKATALVKGSVNSSAGGIATDVTVTTYNGSEIHNKTRLTPEGKFVIITKPGVQYKLTFIGSKYYYHEEMLNVPAADKYQEVPVHVTLKELDLGRPFQFSGLVFEPKSSAISPAVIQDMESIALEMKHNAKLAINATVYTDDIPAGKKGSTTDIGSSRKSAIMAFFLSKNIPASNVSVTVSSSPASGARFERVITEDAPAVSTKGKKKKKAPAPGVAGKKVMVSQDAEIVMVLKS
ncbi:MAG: hypothetical protein WCH46_08390 [bacterium]